MIVTTPGSFSDIVFGLFRLLRYPFSLSPADMPDQCLWCLTVPGGQCADYGVLNAVVTNKLSAGRIRGQGADMSQWVVCSEIGPLQMCDC